MYQELYNPQTKQLAMIEEDLYYYKNKIDEVDKGNYEAIYEDPEEEYEDDGQFMLYDYMVKQEYKKQKNGNGGRSSKKQYKQNAGEKKCK